MQILNEAAKLYEIGLGVHWLKHQSKMPVKPKWSEPKRDSWLELRKSFKPEFNLGVKLGEASRMGEHFLAAIDVDVKSTDPKDLEEALSWIKANFPGIVEKAPYDLSGRGNGSRHYLIRVGKPVASRKLTSSPKEVKVFMPSVKPTKKQIAILGEAEIKKGMRLRPAWEVDFMCVGRQIALPPSIHPDTKKPYRWGRPIQKPERIPLLDEKLFISQSAKLNLDRGELEEFTPENVDLELSNLNGFTIKMIEEGDGVEDRSAACFSVCMSMVRAGFTDNEILSVLTDEDTFLGATAYEHAKTQSRARAAKWVRDYCLSKAKHEVSASKVFEGAVQELPPLNEKEAAQQVTKLVTPVAWEDKFVKNPNSSLGPPKVCLQNVILILENAVPAGVIKRDLFCIRDFYDQNTPWGGKKGKAITDDDAIKIKKWIADHYRFEPSVNLVFEALSWIAEKNAFHSAQKWLRSIPEWDGVNRLDSWLAKNFEAQGNAEYLAQVFRKWMVASVTRIFRAGAKFDWAPIFEGGQGIGKSSFGRILFGEKFFADWLPRLDDKDAALALQGNLCIEFGELKSLKKDEVETVKGFITRQVDKVRPPYGRKQIEIERQCVFYGTTNAEEYLRDETGNRRFNPIVVGKLNFKALEKEREQLWAEALWIFEHGLEPILDLTGEAKKASILEQQKKMVKDDSETMKELLLDFISEQKKMPEKERFPFHKFKLIWLFETTNNSGGTPLISGGTPLGIWRPEKRFLNLASKALHEIGATKREVEGRNWWKIDV